MGAGYSWAVQNSHFTGTLITFLIVAFVIFLLMKVTAKWAIE